MNQKQQIIDVLSDFDVAERISEDQLSVARTILTDDQNESVPWFMQIIQGVGAWFAALLFAGFFFISRFIESDIAHIAVGFILLAVSLFFSLPSKTKKNSSAFLSQLLLAMSLAGHVMLLSGLVLLFSSTQSSFSMPLDRLRVFDMTIVASVFLLISLIFMRFYGGCLHRYLSFFVVLLSVLVIATQYRVLNIFFPVLVVGVAWLSVWIWMREATLMVSSFQQMYRAIQYAAVCALLIGTGMLSFGLFRHAYKEPAVMNFPGDWVVGIGLLLATLYLLSSLLQRQSLAWNSGSGLLLALLAVIFNIIFFNTPAVTASVLVLIIGIERGNRILIPLATFALIFYLGRYYYLLDLTLLYKSLVLMGSGLLLVTAGAWLYRLEGKK